MTQTSPDARPTAAEALNKWKTIRKRVWPTQRVYRLQPQDGIAAEYYFKGVRGLVLLGLAFSRRLLRKAIR